MTSEEDEAWERVQRIESLNRKRQIENQVKRLEQDMQGVKERVEVIESKTPQEFYDELRNNVIEEVAQHVEKLKGFGHDTMSSFAVYIRDLKQ